MGVSYQLEIGLLGWISVSKTQWFSDFCSSRIWKDAANVLHYCNLPPWSLSEKKNPSGYLPIPIAEGIRCKPCNDAGGIISKKIWIFKILS